MEEQADKECGSSIEIVMFAYIPVFSCKKNTGKVGARNQNATLLPPGVNGLGLSDGKSSLICFGFNFFFKIKSIYFFFFFWKKGHTIWKHGERAAWQAHSQ